MSKVEWYTQRSDRGLHIRMDISYQAQNETSSGTSGRCSCFGLLVERYELPLSNERLVPYILKLRLLAKEHGFNLR